MNIKNKFGLNHLSRLEASKPWKDLEHQLEREAVEKANFISDLSCFKDVVENVIAL